MRATSCPAPSPNASQEACHKVLNDPFLLHAVLRDSDSQQQHELETVSHAWRRALSDPTLWVARHEPGIIDMQARSIYTAHQANTSGRLLHFAGQPVLLKRTLGVYAGNDWTLRTGYRPSPPQNPSVTRALDTVVHLRRWGIKPIGRDGKWHATQTKANREQALVFLLDRAYRLKHHKRICVYRADSLFALACACLLAATDYLAPSDTNNGAVGCSLSHGTAQALKVSLTVLLLGTLYMGGIPMVRNIAFGHRDNWMLNQWALAIADWEREHRGWQGSHGAKTELNHA